ncbi:MAG: DUF485 domain-containing protein [Silvibacterium sp.]|jgi:hypothetical protein
MLSSQTGTTQTVWDRVAASRQFRDLMARKKVFVIPAFIFFLTYYFVLPVLVGYASGFMSIKVWVTLISPICSRSPNLLWRGVVPAGESGDS